jgi:signal transduction histidine kinase
VETAARRIVVRPGRRQGALTTLLRQISVSAEACVGDGRFDSLGAAGARARTFASLGDDPTAQGLAGIVFVAELLAAHAIEADLAADKVSELVSDVGSLVELEPDTAGSAIFVASLRSNALLELPPPIAARAVLRLLLAFAPTTEASLWRTGAKGPECLALIGADASSRRVRKLAAEALRTANAVDQTTGFLHAVPVLQWDRPQGVIVIRSRAEDRVRATAFAHEATLALVPILERTIMLERNAERERALVESSERRLLRLGLDLHDGPLQDLAALALDLRLFRQQLAKPRELEPHREIFTGRVDDLSGRLSALERQLRELALSLESATLVHAPFDQLVQGLVDRLASETDVSVSYELRGNIDDFTPSLRIALLRLVEESMSNVREHSAANRLSIAIVATDARVRAEIVDNGNGFDVERTLVEAARLGRLGLVGMGERIRLLGGRLEITSSPGGPTTISATIPRWRGDD